MEQKHLYDLGLIGNCSFLSLIDNKGGIKWLCWPKFDSSFIFGGLLDENKGGAFEINAQKGIVNNTQAYLKNTNILCTEVEAEDGAYKITDFAPRFDNYERHYKPLMLIRKIEATKGAPRIQIKCNPVGDYGETVPEVHFGSNHLRYLGLEKPVRLSTNLSLHYIKEEKSFVLNQPIYLILTWGVPLEGPVETTSETFLLKTKRYWEEWVKRCSIENRWQDAVIRSALTLKMHQFQDTGAIIAATTTSLPEHDGSGRCWDYRYCWMRDTFYTLKALNQIGQFEELEAYSSYIENIAVGENGRYNPVYTILGDDNFEERILDLDGYKGNKPVRVGNQAKEHIQNDVYGQILVSLLPLYIDSRFVTDRTRNTEMIYNLLHKIDETMDESDAGLWEFRNKAFKFGYTFLFHWAGAGAGEKIAQQVGDNKMLKLARRLKKEAAAQIENCYDEELEAYTQAIGTKNMDASMLQLITMGYLNPNSARAKKHLARMEAELMTPEGLFYRYKHADDFGEPKSTFLICTFWYIEALACVGRVKEAATLLDRISKYTNHVGLISEDVQATLGSQWGNFPQTYSHVGLMNAAFRISRKMDQPAFV